MKFNAPEVMELLEASEAAAFLNRQHSAMVMALADPERELSPRDADLAEGLELAARWDGAYVRLRRQVEEDPVEHTQGEGGPWDDIRLLAGELLAWRTRYMGGR